VSGQSIAPTLVCGDVTIDAGFRRGDGNVDGALDIADPIFALNFLFGIGPPSSCAAAMDANGDDAIDVADAVFELSYISGAGPAPPAPFPGCGIDAAPGSLDCQDYGACP
jgi:hypothetical protein